jgi:hypothetical protein
MGAFYPIIRRGVRCRRPDLDTHRMSPCLVRTDLKESNRSPKRVLCAIRSPNTTLRCLYSALARSAAMKTTVLLKSLMNSCRLMGFSPQAENHLCKSLIRSSSESYAPHCSKEGAPMSAMGQSRRFACAGRLSVLSPIATEIAICVHVG